jgi:septal ring factor EnvC (AmiA/AmiB activator)
VIDGMGEVSASGIRSRGITLATTRGAAVSVPADGVVRFAGPFEDYDGVAIIEHRGGWTSLIVNVAPSVAAGARVRSGDPLGRALGPLGVELSRRGQHWSPALIAGSSQTLSKRRKGG